MPLMAKILVVEDQSIVALDIQNRLKSLNYIVTGTASSGAGAVKKAEETQPDLVLMDIMLKGDMDGVEAAEEIRYRFGIPVVYLTAYADSNTLNRAKITEPFGYILKPFQEKELQSTIEMALHHHKMEKQLREREHNFYNTLRSINEGIISTDIHGNVNFINPSAQSVTGWNFRSAIKEKISTILDIENQDITDLSLLVNDNNLFKEFTIKTKNFQKLNIFIKVLNVFNDDNELTGYVIIINQKNNSHSSKTDNELSSIFVDINNNLTNIIANISIIQIKNNLDEESVLLLNEVEESSFAISRIIKNNM
jgi:CheY-like chemotaxis protein